MMLGDCVAHTWTYVTFLVCSVKPETLVLKSLTVAVQLPFSS